MFPHPEDLYRTHQRYCAEMIRNNALEKAALAARRPTHRFGENAIRVGGFAIPRRWWKGLTMLLRRGGGAGTVPTTHSDGVVPISTPPTFPLDSPATALTHTAPGPGRR